MGILFFFLFFFFLFLFLLILLSCGMDGWGSDYLTIVPFLSFFFSLLLLSCYPLFDPTYTLFIVLLFFYNLSPFSISPPKLYFKEISLSLPLSSSFFLPHRYYVTIISNAEKKKVAPPRITGYR
ncbi:hypothetical protein L873DRAFT_842049 [Choiromyces venosus 120613-1]|uniref:Uncharacterized protein n=1 Tax=Choiromyces venosus 120613-1 TaxID=1336337 RepID=A0A3N4JNY8_9PEZI|nr:hypothetical protein L873DRAFT_842049 [Choiromyces venosus 120613-1]